MPIPDFQTIMLPLLEMFKDGEAKTTTQMYAELADRFGLTELERTERLPSGHQTRFHNRVGWARTHLKKAGLLERIGKRPLSHRSQRQRGIGIRTVKD